MKKLIFLILISFALNSCFGPSILLKGDGKIVEKEFNYSGFKNIFLKNSGNIFVTIGENETVSVITDSNMLDKVTPMMIDGKLIFPSIEEFAPSKLEYRVTMKSLEEVLNYGSGDVYITNKITNEDLEIKIKGSGDCSVKDIDVFDLEILVDGSGDVKLSGKSEKLEIDLRGSGSIHSLDLNCNYVDIESEGSGDVIITVLKELDVEIEGSGDVFYAGKPSRINIVASGKGDVKEFKK